MSDSTTFDNHQKPHLTGLHEHPPWYRPPVDVNKGPKRVLDSIIAGPLISNDDGREWFKRTYNYEFPSHSQDYNMPYRLNKLVQEKGIAFACCTAPRRLDSTISDILVITQILQGPFVNDGPENYEEVYQEDRKPIPGVLEEEVVAKLKEDFGEVLH
jgi:hypothetical protein